MASIDLEEAYLQIPVHPDSRRFLRFVDQGNVYQFSALCFGLSTAPQVFSLVMAPVSAILHSWDIRMRRYLDDWLVQSSSRESLLHDLQVVLNLCRELGIVVNPAKSHLEPSQVVQYLGVVIDSRSFRVLHLRIALPGFDQQPTNICPAQILQPVLGSRFWACSPLSPILFREVDFV